jgi:hypothetical protein
MKQTFLHQLLTNMKQEAFFFWGLDADGQKILKWILNKTG